MRGNDLVREYNGGSDRVTLYRCVIAEHPVLWLLIVVRRDENDGVARVAHDSIPDFGSFNAKRTLSEDKAIATFDEIVSLIAYDAVTFDEHDWRSRRRNTNERINQLMQEMETKTDDEEQQ